MDYLIYFPPVVKKVLLFQFIYKERPEKEECNGKLVTLTSFFRRFVRDAYRIGI